MYEYKGQAYTYDTNLTEEISTRDEQPCAIGDVKYYFIDPANPGVSSLFIDGNSKTGGMIAIVLGVIL